MQANQETGTQVKFGDLQLIPVADGLIYIRPVYVVADVAEFRFVIVSYNDRSVLEPTISEALARLLAAAQKRADRRGLASRPLVSMQISSARTQWAEAGW